MRGCTISYFPPPAPGLLLANAVDFSGALEKADLVERCRAAGLSPRPTSAAPAAAQEQPAEVN